MPGRIPQTFIDDLVARVDIVDIIDQRVPLKKTGREYSACCPFHDEKTPSFTVSPAKQFYHCFGCGAHGTVIGFLMEFDHVDFVEAVEELASRENLEVPREGVAGPNENRGPDTRPLYDILGAAERFYRSQLRQHPDAARAVAYLKSRGVSGEVARDFGIGYAPPGWTHLREALGGRPQAEKNLLDSGLVIEKEGSDRRYDRFRDRITFPIRDTRGRVIGFGGRVLGDDKPKYLNSPETAVFHKGKELYGLWEARQALRSISRLLVVEGYMDVVSLAQFGVRYAVATLGTSVTAEHLKRLFRVCSEVVFCFDGDRAGRDAAWRGLENALPLMQGGRQVRFMFLPEGADPDSLIREIGPEAFEARLAESVPLSGFFFERLEAQTDMTSLDGRARLASLAGPFLEKLPGGPFRIALREELSRRTGIPSGAGEGPLPVRPRTAAGGAARSTGGRFGSTRTKRRGASATRPSPVRRAVHMLLLHPELAETVESTAELAYLDAPGVPLLVELLELLRARPHLKTGSLLEHWRDSREGVHLNRLVEQELFLEDEALEGEFRATLDHLEQRAVSLRRAARISELQARFRQLTADEKAELKGLLRDADNAR